MGQQTGDRQMRLYMSYRQTHDIAVGVTKKGMLAVRLMLHHEWDRVWAGQYGRLGLTGRGAARHSGYAERGCAHKEIGEVTARHSRLRIIMDHLGARMTQTG